MKNERQEKIIAMLQENRMVKSTDIHKLFHVSMETVRRDLDELEKEGYLTRVYGGATLKQMYGVEPSYEGRGVKNFHEKQLIGKAAADMVADGDTIIIDNGTTTLEFAKHLQDFEGLTVFTNAIPVVIELKKKRGIRVFMIGGEIREAELSSSGVIAEGMIRRFNVDKLFLGIGGLSLTRGICDYNIAEASLRRTFIDHAGIVIGLADYSKFGVTALNKVCNLQDIDVIVTDDQADRQMTSQLRAMGLTVRVAAE